MTGFGATGGFDITAVAFEVNVPGILTGDAAGLELTYNPAATGPQQLFKADELNVEVPALGLKGAFDPTETTPALVVRTDGFAFGRGTPTKLGRFAVGGVVTITDPFVRLTDFSFSTNTGVHMGAFAVGAAGVAVTPAGGAFTLTGEDATAEIGFDPAGGVDRFTLTIGSLEADIKDIVTLSSTDVAFTPAATGTDPLLTVGEATVALAISGAGINLSGTAGGFSVAGNGAVTGPHTLSATLAFDGTTGGKLKLPTFRPFRIEHVTLDWPAFDTRPDFFQINLSARVFGTIGPITFEGGVDNLQIDPFKLAAGQFPIVGLAGFSVGVSGNLFGGEISGVVVGGIVKLDAEGNALDDTATEFTSTVFYAGIDGSFSSPTSASASASGSARRASSRRTSAPSSWCCSTRSAGCNWPACGAASASTPPRWPCRPTSPSRLPRSTARPRHSRPTSGRSSSSRRW